MHNAIYENVIIFYETIKYIESSWRYKCMARMSNRIFNQPPHMRLHQNQVIHYCKMYSNSYTAFILRMTRGCFKQVKEIPDACEKSIQYHKYLRQNDLKVCLFFCSSNALSIRWLLFFSHFNFLFSTTQYINTFIDALIYARDIQIEFDQFWVACLPNFNKEF